MEKFGIGQPVSRKEDPRLVTGRGRYTDDITIDNQVRMHVVRSPHAHADLGEIRTDAALAAPGVLAVFLGGDLVADGVGNLPCIYRVKNVDGSQNVYPPRPLLALGRARYVGEPVAIVVAETVDAARDAADLIEIDYNPLACSTDTGRTTEPGAAKIWDNAPRNICYDFGAGDRVATDAVFAAAAEVISLDLINNRVVPNYMEPRAALAEYDAVKDHYTLHTSTQSSHRFRETLAGEIFKISEEKLRVVTPDVGGGFGGKINVYPEHALVLWAAKRVGRPVKWTGDRSQGFVADTHGRDMVTRTELALDESGKFLAYRCQSNANLGAYLSNVGTIIQSGYADMQTTVYDIPAVYVGVRGVFTNTAPVCAYRGAGRPEIVYRLERVIDIAARKLGMDPGDLRRRNFLSAEAMPCTTALGMVYDSGDFAAGLDQAKDLADWQGFETRRATAKHDGKLHGIGIASYIDECAAPLLRAEETIIRFEDDDTVTLLIGTQANGQGHETSFAQILTDKLGVPFDRITVREGDTRDTEIGGGGLGSRSITIGGGSVLVAADKVIEIAAATAADILEVAASDLEFGSGEFRVAGTDRLAGLFEIAAKMRDTGGDGLVGTGRYVTNAPTFPNGTHICEV
ncbi:MAG: xanthine dehydrogenase family protein molybdopterin-binding subunit, partial [Proteobacteria bacterium]|nr:xanthine dehydrogenase family protein molybdopterin-binding subunit [Pseudomonadota bacterium]